jgi:hypothetical protein
MEAKGYVNGERKESLFPRRHGNLIRTSLKTMLGVRAFVRPFRPVAERRRLLAYANSGDIQHRH